MTALPEPIAHTIEAIYASYAAEPDEERTYLGASVIGDSCERKLWYAFRWANPPERFSGRMRRLFDTGHREEARMIEDLRRAGIEVHDRDENGDQFGFVSIGGHFRGHFDAAGVGFLEAPTVWHLVEAKTHSLKSMRKLKAKGVKEGHPKHHAQMQIYMGEHGLDRAFYIAHCKTVEEDEKWDDKQEELYSERVKFDPLEFVTLKAKAERIIFAQQPPTKLHINPNARTAFECGRKMCPARGLCHDGDFARVNCRTCLHSTPIADGDGGWHCQRHGRMLDVAEQRVGCTHHLFIPALVPGTQVDADQVAETVTYKLHDGTTWIDGAKQ